MSRLFQKIFVPQFSSSYFCLYVVFFCCQKGHKLNFIYIPKYLQMIVKLSMRDDEGKVRDDKMNSTAICKLSLLV